MVTKIFNKLNGLVLSLFKSDSSDYRSAYDVGATALGHVFISKWVTEGLLRYNLLPATAALITIIGWGVVWETLQYTLNKPTKRVRGRWDAFGDGTAYLTGSLSSVVLLDSTGWWIMTAVTAAMVAINAVLLGRTK